MEEGRTNTCSGKSTHKKDVREGRENVCSGESRHMKKREGGANA